jgi:hypothetical protein
VRRVGSWPAAICDIARRTVGSPARRVPGSAHRQVPTRDRFWRPHHGSVIISDSQGHRTSAHRRPTLPPLIAVLRCRPDDPDPEMADAASAGDRAAERLCRALAAPGMCPGGTGRTLALLIVGAHKRDPCVLPGRRWYK